MYKSNDLPYLAWRKTGLAFSFVLSMIAGLALSINVALAQDEANETEDEEALELQDVRVTGSRLNRPPSELSGNLIVLDREAIRASGELTLARVLRQLPQNVNGTSETFGSDLNLGTNVSAASTVNLRGLGSEYTLILVDGRRIGYSGIFGGVTDISTIPLSMVERIEILLDGASAIYGSDAVGGVVNIITRKDYSGIELDLNYGRPHKSGYDETRVSVSGGFGWDGGRANIGYEYFRDSGLDASDRDSIIIANRDDSGIQRTGRPGPQIRLLTNLLTTSECNAAGALVWELDGNILSRDEYAALDADRQAMATCHNDITLPPGFMSGDDLNGINMFGSPNWGDEAELGYSLRPEQDYNVMNLALDQDISDSITAHATIRLGNKKTTSNRGLSSFNTTVHQNNPHNPFGVRILRAAGQILNVPPNLFDSEQDELFTRLGLEGSFGASWTWQAEFSRSEQEIASQQLNVLDGTTVNAGFNSDGVTDVQIAYFGGIDLDTCEQRRMELGGSRISWSGFFGGQCRVYAAPPTPIDPFSDLSSYVAPGLNAGSENEQTQFEALARGELFEAPGGRIALVVGFDYRKDVLDSFSEHHANQFGRTCSPISCPSVRGGSPAGSAAFSTSISRTAQAGFFEGLIPLIGADNQMPGVQRLNLTFSGRHDSYSNVEVEYRETQSGAAGTDNPADPGSEFTYSTGIVYQVNDSVRFKADRQTSFVAPQLNQLIQRTNERARPGFGESLCLLINGGPSCSFANNTVLLVGRNEKLTPETAENLSLTAEASPPFLPGIFLRAVWSDTEYRDRIFFLNTSPFGVDPNNLPSDIIYIPEEDIYLVEKRWINVSNLFRTGMDYELRYDWQMGLNDFSILVRRSYTNRYDVRLDPTSDELHNLVTRRDDTGHQQPRYVAPVPKHQTSMQFTWSNGGLFMSIDVQGAAKVSTLVSSTFESVTEPATIYDMVLGYEFGNDSFFDAPAWLNGFSTTLTINNLTNAFAENTQVNPETGDVQENVINPFFEWTQGRSYRLAIHKSF